MQNLAEKYSKVDVTDKKKDKESSKKITDRSRTNVQKELGKLQNQHKVLLRQFQKIDSELVWHIERRRR